MSTTVDSSHTFDGRNGSLFKNQNGEHWGSGLCNAFSSSA
ncbi:MAG: hypothetical protein JWR22_3227 [Herminiimonas sp.]|nr:hypothetical protein [Herminiimonas sp.]